MKRIKEYVADVTKNNITKFMIIIEMLVIFIVFQVLTGGLFMSSRNLSNLLVQSCTYSLLGIGMTLVMVAGHIDLSVGSVVGFLGAFAAMLEVKLGCPAVVTIAATIALGILIYCWQGYWIACRHIPAFIVTLSGQLLFKGGTLWITNGASIGPMSENFSKLGRDVLPKILFKDAAWNDASILFALILAALYLFITLQQRKSDLKFQLDVPSVKKVILKTAAVFLLIGFLTYILVSYKGIPYAVILLILMAVLFFFISQNTRFGRNVYAIGGNKDAAKLSGINIEKTNMMIFISMGFIASLASITFLGRVGQATAVAGTNFEFSAITGCIVGGTSTLGGVGTIPGAVIGTILMAGIDNGMSLMNLPATSQYIVKALVLLFAVAVDVASKREK